MSESLGRVLTAIQQPAYDIFLTACLMVASGVIYAAFGFHFFAEQFQFGDDDDNDDNPGCQSMPDCFGLVAYRALPAGDITEILSEGSITLSRVLYDLSFFVWIGVLLFNIVTGLMVDTFGALREEAAARIDVCV